MSDEAPEDFSFPGSAISREVVTVRVGSFNYLFERAPQGGLVYVSRSPAFSGDDDYNPLDPSEYR